MRIEYDAGYSKDSPMARDAREILESVDVEALAADTGKKGVCQINGGSGLAHFS